MPSSRPPIDPSWQASGGNILAILAAMGAFRPTAERILRTYGIGDVTADGWYPVLAYRAALDEIAQRIGPSTLKRVGARIADFVPLPPGTGRVDFAGVLALVCGAFTRQHQGAGMQRLEFTVKGDGMGTVHGATIYPCEFNQGVLQGFYQKLAGLRVTVAHAPGAGCVRDGAPRCTYLVTASRLARAG